MLELFPDLFIGNATSFAAVTAEGRADYGEPRPGWYIVSAAKDPWHRTALGYTERAAPKDHPEYLIARRDRHMILNLIDAPDPAYIPDAIMAAAIEAIDEAQERGLATLVHCNEGYSRAPSVALWWLRNNHWTKPVWSRLTFDQAIETFTEMVPGYEPKDGIKGWLRAHWEVSDGAGEQGLAAGGQ